MSPSPQSSVRIWWDASIDAYRLTSPYNKSLVVALKELIPGNERSYDPISHIWTFVEKWLEPTVKLCEATLRGRPQILTRQQVESASQAPQGASRGSGSSPITSRNANIDDIMIQFVKLLPFEAAQRAYRHAAMLLHPDRPGGSMDKMALLNSAWQRLEKELWQQ